jgi:hypothetical protein
MSEPVGIGIDETRDRYGAFPRLGSEQVARFRAVGSVREVLRSSGSPHCAPRPRNLPLDRTPGRLAGR